MEKHLSSTHRNPSFPSTSIVLELGGLKRGGSPELRLLYTLSGKAKLTHNDLHRTELNAGSIHIINPGDFFEITNMDNFSAATFLIPMEAFYSLMPSLSDTYFSIRAAGVCQEDYDALSQLLLRSLKLFSDDSEENAILQSLNTHSLILLLLKKFQQQPVNSINLYKTNDSTIQKLMAYIDQNSRKKLSLPALSEMVYLNPQYLSRLFKRETGITLIRYINQVRILKSEQDILYSNLSAADIAEKHGFANTKSFYKAFREVFGKTPGAHKANFERESNNQQSFSLRCPSPLFYTKEIVKQFIHSKGDNSPLDIPLPDPTDWFPFSAKEQRVQIPVSSWEGDLHPHWSYALRPDFLENGRSFGVVTENIFRAIGKINSHILTYGEDREGQPYYTFSRLDSMTDYYLAQGLTVIVEIFQFQTPRSEQFYWHDSTETMQSGKKWISFVSALVKHMYDRLGAETMRSIFFSFCPDPTLHAHWQGTQTEFFELLASACQIIKSIDSHLKVGIQNINPENTTIKWLQSLKMALEKKGTSLNFIGCMISFLCPNPTPPAAGRRFSPEIGRGHLLADSHDPLQWIQQFRQRMEQSGFLHTKLFITSAMPTHLLSDQTQNTCYLNAYIVKTLLEFLPVVDHIHFDIHPAAPPHPLQTLYWHDGFHAALHISRTNIFRLLSRLDNGILQNGAGYLVTANKNGNSFQILCYNYCHYRPNLKSDDLLGLPLSSLYGAFSPSKSQQISVTLQDFQGSFRVRKYRLDMCHGSAFDVWLQMGAPEHLSTEEIHHIQSRSLPDYSAITIRSEGSYTFECLIAPHEVEFIAITRET